MDPIKEQGLSAFSALAFSVKPDTVDSLLPVLRALTVNLATLPPGSFFSDIAQPSHRSLLPLIIDGSYRPWMGRAADGGKAAAVSSSERDDKCPASAALIEGASEYWCASPDATSSWWELSLPRPTFVALLHLSWRWSSTARGLPERYTVTVSTDGGKSWAPVCGANGAPAGRVSVDLLPPQQLTSQRICIDAEVTNIRVNCEGYCKASPPSSSSESKPSSSSSTAPGATVAAKDRAHSLVHVCLFAPDTSQPHVSPKRTLLDLIRIGRMASMHGRDAETVAAGLQALAATSLASASSQGLLHLALALIALQAKPASSGGSAPSGRGKKQQQPATPSAAASNRRVSRSSSVSSQLSGQTDSSGDGALATDDISMAGGPLSPSAAPISAPTPKTGAGRPRVPRPPAHLAALPSPIAKLQLTSLAPLVGDGSSGFDIASFMRGLSSGVDEELELLVVSGKEAPPPLLPRWDADCKSGNIELSADDTMMTSTTSTKAVSEGFVHCFRESGTLFRRRFQSHSPLIDGNCNLVFYHVMQHVYGTVGFNRGKALWEFSIDKDTRSDECTCVGAGIKPVVSSQYDQAENLFMIRCYNGRCYQGGTATRTIEKIHPNDTVRFELDCEAGEISCWVNGNEQGVVFKGLQGKTVFPAACTYSENRGVKITKLEAWGQSSGGEGEVAVTALADLAQGRLGITAIPGTGAAAAASATGANTIGGRASVGTPAGTTGSAWPFTSPAHASAAGAAPFDAVAFAASLTAAAAGGSQQHQQQPQTFTPTSAVRASPSSLNVNAPAFVPSLTSPSAAPAAIGTPASSSSSSYVSLRGRLTSATPSGGPTSATGSIGTATQPQLSAQPLTHIRSEGHYVTGGLLESSALAGGNGGSSGLGSPGSLGAASLAQPIMVGGVHHSEGISLRPDAISGTPAVVSYPLTVPSNTGTPASAVGGAASKFTFDSIPLFGRLRPFQWFVGRVAVDDTSH